MAEQKQPNKRRQEQGDKQPGDPPAHAWVTPGAAEGDRETVEESLRNQEKKQEKGKHG